jgi:isoquinoline 1-oxidoreductase beta subunit
LPYRWSCATLRSGIVQQSNFDDYEPTRIREMPKVEVHIPTGIWKPDLSPVASAIGNAVAAATCKRLHTLPLGLTTLSG